MLLMCIQEITWTKRTAEPVAFELEGACERIRLDCRKSAARAAGVPLH